MDLRTSDADARFGHIINGKLVIPSGAKTTPVVNPATEETFARVPVADRNILDVAVTAARAAFPSWSAKSWDERAATLTQWGQAYEAQIPSLLDLSISEQGKSRFFAEMELRLGLRWFQETTKMRLGDEILCKNDNRRVYKRYRPLGVAGLLIPWNSPVLLMIWKIIPALLTGCCAIVKPSPYTPLCSILIVAEAARHFSPGVVQIVVGDDTLGPMFTSHPGIDKISFTGSTAAGRLVARDCAATLKRVTLELGGNDAAIIGPDVDIQIVAPQVTLSAVACSAQFCCASKRIYIHTSIYKEFCAAMVSAVKGLEEVDPLNNKAVYDKVGTFFADSKANGHTFLCGGEIPETTGYLVPISFVDNPPDDSRIVREEPFGPIVPLLKWDNEEDLLRRVNDSEMGLGASVWFKDSRHAEAIARRIDCGLIFVGETPSFSPDVPFGGWKQSGIGSEHGLDGLKAYCLTQSIHVTQSRL